SAAILAVAKDRRIERGAMGPQLMRAPGDRQQRDPAHSPAGIVDHAIKGDGALAAFVIGMYALALGTAAFCETEINAAALRTRQAGDNSPIDFPGRLLAEGPGEKRRRGRMARDQQDSRGVLVETMHET